MTTDGEIEIMRELNADTEDGIDVAWATEYMWRQLAWAIDVLRGEHVAGSLGEEMKMRVLRVASSLDELRDICEDISAAMRP